jgi:hypothetical protein
VDFQKSNYYNSFVILLKLNMLCCQPVGDTTELSKD